MKLWYNIRCRRLKSAATRFFNLANRNNMLETSKDLLNIVIALCVLWFTVFLCWMIYYMAMILKRVNEVMEKVTGTLDAIAGFFTKAKEKINSVGSTLATAMELGKKVVEIVKEKQEKKRTARRAKSETTE